MNYIFILLFIGILRAKFLILKDFKLNCESCSIAAPLISPFTVFPLIQANLKIFFIKCKLFNNQSARPKIVTNRKV